MFKFTPRNQERTIPVFIYIFCISIIYLSLNLEKAPEIFIGEAMQPRDFPLFLMGLIAVINLFYIRDINLNPITKLEPQTKVTWGSILLMLLFSLVTVYVDIIIAVALVIFLYCRLWGETRNRVAAALAILTPFIIFFIFDLVLEIRFPKGILTSIYYS